jgi:hypothetical protein
MAWFPPRPTARYRLKQVLWAFVRVDLDDPKPAIYAVNPAGYGLLLFRTATYEEADVQLDLVGRELHGMGLAAFCERYRIPMTFVESLEPSDQFKGLRRFRPML